MSASFFSTILTADARTHPDGVGVQYAPAGTQQPRWTDSRERDSWAAVHVLAEGVVQIAAQAIADTPMDGLTGDHPTKRHHLVTILDAVANAVRVLALDADGDGVVTDERWDDAIGLIRDAAAIPFPVPAPASGRERIEIIDA